MNNLRRCSLSFSVRSVDANNILTLDDQATEAVVEAAKQFYPDFSDLEEDINPDYGIVIVSRGQNTKRAGTRRLMAALGLSQVAAIGNSMGDYLGSDGIALHYAVSDATAEFKEIADYIAKGEVTAGSVEIIKNLWSA
jgi:hydroxymethylpyrimidine pyrophosphatase-like HAD family hydrolase